MSRPQPPWIPVGIDGIATALDVSENTVMTWRRRSAEWIRVEKFPDPEGRISNRAWWWLADVIEWAKSTGRLPTDYTYTPPPES
ncbi:hypothetical protein SAMN05216275_119107 [Streptosporangium canum]|uniref:Uncharacterized protein n=1 Tax=Streptosporangium canum TaxID=324952 RepID=A0A1I3XL51_9ACTN|nr:hypothetical protein [Streptosporangium canum]SFK20208.1 hypothetical protein SAMN05216275_119107 [Streptosporangium canum]